MNTMIAPNRREEDKVLYLVESGAFSSGTFYTNMARNLSLFYLASKRLLDIVLATVGLVALLPVFFVIAVCIKLDDGGDIFYFREMVGLHGRRFTMLKFRTMIPHADG